MPVVTQPDLIEVSDFLGGVSIDGENATTNSDVLLDVSNLFPDVNTGSLVTRPGFTRVSDPVVTNGSGHYLKQVFNFGTGSSHYIIVVATNGAAAANNVRLFAAEVDVWEWQRIDDSGVTWTRPLSDHWGVAVDRVWYGGSETNEMYSWDPSGWDPDTSDAGTWDSAAGTGNWKTWVNDTNTGVDTATEWAKDYAWQGKERVLLSGDTYQPARSIRYAEWDIDNGRYAKGDRVSIIRTWDTGPDVRYWKSYKCTENHTADADHRPGDGTGSWQDVWVQVTLDKPINEDSETSKDWLFVPVAAETSVAAWHANRLFMRYDDQGDKSRLLYSAPIKPEKGADVPDTVWRPTDFAPSTEFDGAGGGWLPVSDGKHGGVIEALHSYNQYLLIFKRRVLWQLSGTDEGSWSLNNLGHPGCLGPLAKVESEGLLYFLSDNGLFVTDGTTVEPAKGSEKVNEYIRERIDPILENRSDTGLRPTMFGMNDLIFITLPDEDADQPFLTVAYEPKTGSFWPSDLPMVDAQGYRHEGRPYHAFVAGYDYGTGENLVYKMGGTTDDDGLEPTVTPLDIPFTMSTAWLPFGTAREERRVRRIWAIVRQAGDYTLSLYKNFDYSTATTNVTRTVAGSVAQFIEGKVANTNAYSIAIKLSGVAPATVHSYAVDTEPRRTRFHQ